MDNFEHQDEWYSEQANLRTEKKNKSKGCRLGLFAMLYKD